MDNLDNIYKALRLVPEFDGNPNILTRFVKLCDQLFREIIIANPDNELYNLALINGILNKITGPAARLINSNGIPSDWTGIRNALINNFADQRDETALYNDLALLTQGPGTPQDFYERCQNLFATIMTYVTLHESLDTTIEAKRDLYKKLTLQAYLRGLKDPLGSRIRCMRPSTTEQALEFVHEELNTMYLQQRNDQLPDRKVHTQNSHSSMGQNKFYGANFHKPQPKPFTFNMPGPSRSHALPVAVPPVPHIRQNFGQFNQPGMTRTQQMFRAVPPNYNYSNNTFRMPPRNPPQQYPRPMSGVSNYAARPPRPNNFGNAHDWTKSGNPPPSNYFRSREVNFNDCMPYEIPQDEYYGDNYYNYMPYEPYEHADYCYDNEYVAQQFDKYPQVASEDPNDAQHQLVTPYRGDDNQDFQKSPKFEKQK
jgi:hypothetical protein